jgi:protein SERAC1
MLTETLSLILVHGLTGNRNTTWTHNSTDFFWPLAITEDIRSACVSTFGYKVNPSIFCGNPCSGPILDCARNLLDSLLQHRSTHEELPIIFIVHGLGGHICEQALLLCQESLDLQRLRSSTYAIIFLDTPHSGDLLARPTLAFEKYFRGLHMPTRQEVVEFLPSNSDLFPHLETEFNKLLHDTHDRIKTADWVGNSSSEEQDMPVSNELALIPTGPGLYPLGKHADVAKFSGKDDMGYEFVLNNIKKWMYAMP